MEDRAVQNLARRYQPVVYLHSKETFLPINFNQYVDACRLKSSVTGQVVNPNAPFSALTFGELLTNSPQYNTPDYTLFLRNGMDFVYHYNPTEYDLEVVPLYVNFRQVVPPYHENPKTSFHIYISYTHMYAYNGPQFVCCKPVGEHFADSEHVTIDLSVSRYGDVSFNRMYTSRHNGGVWTPGPALLWNDGIHPTVFSSLNGHASYTAPGNYSRYWGVVKDQCNYGIRWNTSALVFLPHEIEAAKPEMKWTCFKGSLGDGSVDCFGSKSYMTSDEIEGEYGASLLPWKWKF